MQLRDPTHKFEGEISPTTRKIAYAISIMGQPFFIPVPFFALLCMIIPDINEYMKILLISVFFVATLPTITTYYFSLKQGWKDGDIPDRRKRPIPMIIGILSYTAGTIVLYLVDAPTIITLIMGLYAVVTTVMLIITFYWKISIHAVGVMGPTIALSYTFWPWGLLFGLVIPPIIWSRYVLKKHTPAQLAAGMAVGIIITTIGFILVL